MNGGELYIRATGTWLPPVERVADAVADGRTTSADALVYPSGEKVAA
ncbi:hypothetical protein [Streptomyces violarus]|nr:hypothetical protein [Streptomyces violarus]MCT9140823.1 hypothetical protein [Streptomyces violarus]